MEVFQLQEKKELSAWKEKIMSLKMGMLFFSDSTFKMYTDISMI